MKKPNKPRFGWIDILPKFDLKMKFSLLFFAISLFQLHAEKGYAQRKTISLNMEQVSVLNVMEEIESISEFKFFFSKEDLDLERKVTIRVRKERIGNVLQNLFTEGEVTYKVVDKQIVLTPSKIQTRPNPKQTALNLGEQQDMNLVGNITDENGEPIPGITIYISSRQPNGNEIDQGFFERGTSTDFDGNYSILGEVGNYVAAYGLGFKLEWFPITAERTTYNFVLKESLSKLDEVLVVGYGTTKKRDLTGSVSSVQAEEIKQIQTQSVDQALVGQLPGVFVNAGGGAPGASNIVNIRGLTGLTGGNQPLYVVDGVPILVSPVYPGNSVGNLDPSENPLLAINPNDVERIDVLKDASAAAIYGSRAANGVIIITTKKGKLNRRPTFNIGYTATVLNTANTYDVLNASEYRQVLEENEIDTSELGSEDTDWQDLLTNQNALWNQWNLNVSGGTQKTTYFVSANASEEEGVALGTRFNRFGMNVNVNSEVLDKLRIGANLNYNNSLRKTSGVTGLGGIALTRPDLGVFNDDGTFTSVPFFGGLEFLNPLGDEAKVRNRNAGQNVLASLYGEYEIFEGLTFKSLFSASINSFKNSSFSPSTTDTAIFSRFENGGVPGGVLQNSSGGNVSTTFNNTLTYNKSWDNGHNLNVLAGVIWDRSRFDLESQRYVGFPDDELLIGPGNASNFVGAESAANLLALNSLIGRINYNYKNRYLLTLTGRSDTSIKFGPENRTGYFPSAGIAWNVHNESFFKENNVLNNLKFRASWGITGSDNLPAFSYIPTYGSGGRFDNTVYNGVNGIEIVNLSNPTIQWEETEQFDVGLEFGLFKNRLNAEITYFEKNTTGLITNAPAVLETGFDFINTNLADVSNKGIEVSLGATVIQSQNFTWETGFNISSIQNKVESLNGGGSDLLGIVEGEPIGVIQGFDVLGIVQTQEEADALNANAPNGTYYFGTSQPGDYIHRDVNGDGEITNDEDEVVLGSIVPDYFGGWNNTFTYKNLSLSLGFQFVEGVERLNRQVGSLSAINLQENEYDYALNSWTPDRTDAFYAQLGSFSHFEFNSRQVEDASYVRLRFVSFAYDFPRKLFSNSVFSGARLTLNANNVFTWTDYTGLDPEGVTPQGSRRGNDPSELTNDQGVSYPLTRTISIGLNLNF